MPGFLTVVMPSIDQIFALVLLLFSGYYMVDWRISPRRYNNALVILSFVDILCKLDDDNVLISKSKKASLRVSMRDLALLVPQLSTVNKWSPSRTSPKIKKHFEEIAALIMQTRELVSIPDSSTLSFLRNTYTNWFELFLHEKYGSIKPSSEGEKIKIPWYQGMVSFTRRHLGKGVLIFFVVFGCVAILADNSPRLAESLLALLWLVTRYVLLIMGVMAIYLQWGAEENAEHPRSKMENTVFFVMFFLLPFVILDQLLNTQILSTLATLAGAIKIF